MPPSSRAAWIETVGVALTGRSLFFIYQTMKLSLFTPTHDVRYLHQTYFSLRHQAWKDWEWLLVPNGGATIPDDIAADPRVRIARGAEWYSNVGALKRFACERCSGDVLIELDHDDVLVPGDSLDQIAAAAQAGAGFVYSDSAMFRGDKLQACNFSSEHGWESYPIEVYGRKLLATKPFPVTPRSLCEIYYAPDHVRAWTRDAYWQAGGHNAELIVGDDHDLMCRTYLAGIPFGYTGSCQYLYRSYAQNTVHRRQMTIREQVLKNKQKYSSDLIREWCRREGHKLLEITRKEQPGWRGERGSFGEAESCGAILCHDLFQLVQPAWIPIVMEEAYQALVPGGYLEIVVPGDQAATLEPRATRVTKATFLPYCYTDLKPYIGRDVDVRFQMMHAGEAFPSEFHRQENLSYAIIQLCALKGQRQPALQSI